MRASRQARELEKTAASKGVEIILPTDVVVADAFSADANTQVRRTHTHKVMLVGSAFLSPAPIISTRTETSDAIFPCVRAVVCSGG